MSKGHIEQKTGLKIGAWVAKRTHRPLKIRPAFTVPQKFRLKRPQPPLKNAQGRGWGNRLVAMLPDGVTKPVYEVRSGQVDIGGKPYPINLPDGFYIIRKLTPVECERLQTLPDGYTEGVSATQRYKCLGNGWTVDVIAHILKSLILQ